MAQWANHQYRLHALAEEQRRVLPPSLRRDTPDFHQRASTFKDAAIRNQFCLDCILRHAGQPHSQEYTTQSGHSSDAQMSKVSSVLKSLVRDWSAEGKPERDMAYKPCIELVQTFVPLQGDNGAPPPRICVPGAGVGRLALELSSLGYTVQGNEFSLYMLLASDFILNGGIVTPATPIKISPWLLESRNLHRTADQVRIVEIPDVDPYSMLSRDGKQPGDFSMAAGEFVSVYSTPRERGQWDAVVSCFFVDASPSIVEYLQVIYQMLKPGGYLINFGPLLWHWSGPAMRPDDKTVQDYQERYSYLE
jgi:carnosine N-methyltransferase